ncbi:hypothetical protein FB451DRAFT_1180527 [Mycena latifolia]|nr:hypothetical protein FB451DRAFT_1180527 [Mycena latifolia]
MYWGVKRLLALKMGLKERWMPPPPHFYQTPRGALRIKMRAQRNQGFDPTSTTVAEAFSLPLLLIPDPEALEGYGEESADLEPDWSGFHELDGSGKNDVAAARTDAH